MNYFLRVDGGGSKTRAILVDAEGDVLLDVLSGPTNLNVAPEGDVRRSLEDLIDVFREKVKVDKVSACFGIAGTSNTTNAITLSKIFKTIGFRDFTLKTDAEIALAGAFKGDSGILLIAGTGSVCLVGGLLEHHHNFRDSLAQRMPELILASPILPPAGGAAWIARSLSNGDSDQHWTNRVINALSGGETRRP